MQQRIEIIPLSSNKAWKGRRFKTDDYKIYERSCFYLLKKGSVTGNKLRIEFVFGFSNTSSDIDNGVKSFLDILQKKYGFNDSAVYELNIKKEIVPKGKEFIDFKIKEIV